MKDRSAMIGAVVAVAALAVQTGCLPVLPDVDAEMKRSRRSAYERWASGRPGEENLRKLEADLSLEKAISIALAENLTLQAAQQDEEKAKGQIKEAYGEVLPTLELNASYTRADDTLQQLGLILNSNLWSAGVTITQPIYKGGAISAAMRGARYFSALSSETVRRQTQATIQSVSKVYYDVLLAEEMQKVQQDALDFAQKNLKDVKARVNAGLGIPYDQLRAEVEVSNVEADLIQQSNQLERARTALFRLIGVSQQSKVTLTDRQELEFVELNPVFERAVKTAFENRPELFMSELDLRVQQEYLRTLQSKYWPTVELWGTQEWDKPGLTANRWEDQWTAGLRLKWTLFDGFARRGRIMQQTAVLRQGTIQLRDAEQTVLEEITNALLDLESAAKLVRSQEDNVKRATEARRLIEVGVQQGVKTPLDALDASTALTRAIGLRFQALYQHAVARLALQRALGELGAGRPKPASEIRAAGQEDGDTPTASAPDEDQNAGK